jgi:hypothetical protein
VNSAEVNDIVVRFSPGLRVLLLRRLTRNNMSDNLRIGRVERLQSRHDPRSFLGGEKLGAFVKLGGDIGLVGSVEEVLKIIVELLEIAVAKVVDFIVGEQLDLTLGDKMSGEEVEVSVS